MIQMRTAWHEGLESDAKGLLSRYLSGALCEAKDSCEMCEQSITGRGWAVGRPCGSHGQ